MTLTFMDGFDSTLDNGLIVRKWTGSALNANQDTTTGRFGTGLALRLLSVSVTTAQLASNATVVVGFAFRTGLSGVQFVALLLDTGTVQVDLRMDSTNHLLVTRNGTQVGSTSTNAMVTNTWYYVEWKTTINNSTGSFEVRVDGVTWVTGSSLDTQNTANAFVNQLRLTSSSASFNTDYDDLYICDTAGSVNNDFLGDSLVETLRPSGAGNTTGFTPNTGANYAAVDEAQSNDDTDYVASATVNAKDTYALGNLTTASGTVRAVQTYLVHKRDNAGARSVCPVVRHSSTDYDLTTVVQSASYVVSNEIRETNPGTSAAWTISDLNNLEAGVKVVS